VETGTATVLRYAAFTRDGVGGNLAGVVLDAEPLDDAATGAAAAAFGGYLRGLGLVRPPAEVTVVQGEDMGRPSELLVTVPADDDRIHVTGTAGPLAEG
jgi:predicted PhzF superfamily epimerase YddE/YHI9